MATLHLPLELGAREQCAHSSKRGELGPKSASAPRTWQSVSQPVSGAPHHAVPGRLVHELPPRFPMPSPSFGTTHANGRQPQSPSPRFGPAQCMSMMMPRAGQVATHRPLKLAGRLRAPDTRPRWLLSGVVCPLCRDHTAPWLARRAVAGPLPPLPFPSTNDASWNPAAIVSIPEQQAPHLSRGASLRSSRLESRSLIGSPRC